MLLRTILNEVVPKGIREYITVKLVDYFSSYFQSDFTFVIEQHWGEYVENQTFLAAQVYLPTRLAGLTTGKLLVGSNNLKNPTAQPKLGIPVDTKIMDEFEGIHLEWNLHNVKSKGRRDKQYFHLTCKKEFREKILADYFAYVTESAEKHHTTFETLAIEPDLKTTLMNDLDAFSKGKDFFKSVGRAWKRVYLLYGPPGTGKSSMVAAIANQMKYNIYDLQIQSVKEDGELREILTSTTNRSILLIEEIDCGSDVSDDESKKGKNKYEDGILLSGLLNFVDGLWSSCGEEKIIIFTTNHKEMLDPALLRPGRIDVHILMVYCTPLVFNKLVSLYPKIDGHILCDAIEKLFLEVSITPAEITQQLMASKDADIALKGVIEYLETKKIKRKKIQNWRLMEISKMLGSKKQKHNWLSSAFSYL
ncbi:hypothetical protein Bca101_026580 [Brassica carinata]